MQNQDEGNPANGDETGPEAGDGPATGPAGRPMPGFLRVASIAYLALFLAGWLWIHLRGGNLIMVGSWGLFAEAGAGAGLGLAVAGLSLAFSRVSRLSRRLEEEFRGLLGPLKPGESILLAALSGVAEEAFFRGALQPAAGIVATSLIFGVLHTGPKRVFLAWTGFAVAMGFLLGWLFEASGGLAAPTALHVVVNALNLWRIGGGEGPKPPAAKKHSRSHSERTRTAEDAGDAEGPEGRSPANNAVISAVSAVG